VGGGAAGGKRDAYAGELPMAYVQLVKDATATPDELSRFVLDAIPERAAAPKEIVILERMPLTDVGKPAKPQLRRDAAQRTLRSVLTDAIGAGVEVDVIADEAAGTRAVLTLHARASADMEQRIRALMAAYPLAYTNDLC